MKTPTIGSTWKWFLSNLHGVYPENELQAVGREVFRHFYSIEPAERVLKHHQHLSKPDFQMLEIVVEQLKNYTPLQHITGVAHFFDLRFIVNQNVLIPRPETEELVQWALDTLKEDPGSLSEGLSLIDVGTGSGCIAIALAKNLNNTRVWGCDISEKAIELARKNAENNQVEVNFFTCDILNDNPDMHGLDLVVSNPPYIRRSEKVFMKPNVLNFEPFSALFVGDDDPLVFYRAIARKSMRWLKSGGWLLFEINENLGSETMECIEKEGFVNVELKQDIYGRDRMLKAKKCS